FSSRRRHTRFSRDWSSDVCSSDLATGFILLALYIALAKKQGADIKKISGTIQNDILKEYAARGTYIYPPAPSMRIITDIFEYCRSEERRVGKECRSGWWWSHRQKN